MERKNSMEDKKLKVFVDTREVDWCEDNAIAVLAVDKLHAERCARCNSSDFSKGEVIVTEVKMDKEKVIFHKGGLHVGIVEGYYVEDNIFGFNIRVSLTLVYTYTNHGDVGEHDIIGKIVGRLSCYLVLILWCAYDFGANLHVLLWDGELCAVRLY